MLSLKHLRWYLHYSPVETWMCWFITIEPVRRSECYHVSCWFFSDSVGCLITAATMSRIFSRQESMRCKWLKEGPAICCTFYRTLSSTSSMFTVHVCFLSSNRPWRGCSLKWSRETLTKRFVSLRGSGSKLSLARQNIWCRWSPLILVCVRVINSFYSGSTISFCTNNKMSHFFGLLITQTDFSYHLGDISVLSWSF